jgi:hypothetical protein
MMSLLLTHGVCVGHFLRDLGSEAALHDLLKKTLSQCEQQYFVNFVAHIF